jgi:hypothetical protein
MLFPFLGLFVSLAIWGTFYPVPGFIRPSDGFVRRIFGAFEAAACAGEIYCAIEVVRVYAGPWHRDSASHVREVTFGGFEEYICLLNGTEVKTSVAIQLGDETVVEQPVVDGGNCTDLVVAVGNDEEWLVETGYAGGDSLVFISPILPQAAGWASPGAWLSFSAFVWDLFPPLLTYCQMLLKGWVGTLNPHPRWLASLWSIVVHRPPTFSAALTPALVHLHSLWRERWMVSSSTTWWRRLSVALNDKGLLQCHRNCNASSEAGPPGPGAPERRSPTRSRSCLLWL